MPARSLLERLAERLARAGERARTCCSSPRPPRRISRSASTSSGWARCSRTSSATPSGTRPTAARSASTSPPGRAGCRIAVSDQGPGIAAGRDRAGLRALLPLRPGALGRPRRRRPRPRDRPLDRRAARRHDPRRAGRADRLSHDRRAACMRVAALAAALVAAARPSRRRARRRRRGRRAAGRTRRVARHRLRRSTSGCSARAALALAGIAARLRRGLGRRDRPRRRDPARHARGRRRRRSSPRSRPSARCGRCPRSRLVRTPRSCRLRAASASSASSWCRSRLLLISADAAFAAIADDIPFPCDRACWPAPRSSSSWSCSAGALGLGLVRREQSGSCRSSARARSRPIEWILPLAALVALFVAFVGVQVTVLFGGRDHVLRTTGLTYARVRAVGVLAAARHGCADARRDRGGVAARGYATPRRTASS